MGIVSQRSATVKLKMGIVVSALMCLLIIPSWAQAQQQGKSSDQETIRHLKLDFLLTEYNGEQKISSMPYTMYVEAASHRSHPGHLRMGLQVPDKNNNSYNVGTNIDCSASVSGDNSYDLDFTVSRSSIYSAIYSANEQATETAHDASGGRPVMRTFNADFSLEMHDGQTAEGPAATDPFNGNVLKISVTLHVIK